MDALSINRLAWFGGNTDALAVFEMLITLSHTWDDIIDNDSPISHDEINTAFTIALVKLPLNPFYRYIQNDILPLWRMVISAYEAANSFESLKEPHGIEISHSLRYAAGHIIVYMVHVCIGDDAAKLVVTDVWKDIFFERFDEYKKEHLDA